MLYIIRASVRTFVECRTSKFSTRQSLCRFAGLGWTTRGVSSSTKKYKRQKDPARQFPELEDRSDDHYRKIKHVNPYQRTYDILTSDVKNFYKSVKSKINRGEPQESRGSSMDSRNRPEKIWPSYCDVLVVGGGVMGSSVAYHLKERALQGLNVVVVEHDSTYKKASTVLSVGGIRQQFSVPENIQLSMYGVEFLRKSKSLLAVEGMDPPDIQFNPHGYLTLASEAGIQQLIENYNLQREMGAKVDFLSAVKLKQRFPWLNTDGVEAGVIGLENEGWFDPWSLLFSLKRKAVSLGAQYVTGKVTGLNSELQDEMILEGVAMSNIRHIKSAEVTLPNGEKHSINFSILVVAAGAWSSEVGHLVGIGDGDGIMSFPVPVEPRKRYVYCVHAPNGPGLNSPLVIDPNGTYFRREGLGGLYLCGQSPKEVNEPSIDNLEVDYEYFEDEVWPTIAHRVPSFENLKLHTSWAGYYDYNTFDQNGIVGLHPLFSNMFLTTGFSGHGIQQAPGVGRAVMECILQGEYCTINLERLGFDRIIANTPLFEKNIV
ncbi:FAD-dependent oxidoreductase domain-containing protein 1-like [Panulirus ornatus]|uniref:FAD-dependent oxidoreductase domain-containing protein 1-like n=1 Tax=Panulirus ornatus TaxID=150431 RepID=UPI003A87B0AC